MAVYVDDMSNVKMGRLGRMKMSHMIADTPHELFLMADNLGLKTEWFQPMSYPHFDISITKKNEAKHLGAKSVTMRELAKIRRGLSQDMELNIVWRDFLLANPHIPQPEFKGATQ